MANDRFSQALSRIEAATATIEARLAAQDAAQRDGAGPTLAVRHERLRDATMAAMLRLDRLIGLAGDDEG